VFSFSGRWLKYFFIAIIMINYDYNKIHDILYVQYSGEITIEELLNYISEVGNDNTYPRILKILEDRRNGSFPFSIRANIKISKHALKFAKKYKKVYMAALNDKPKETAYTIDYQRLLSKFTSTQTTRTFSTFEAAQQWLLNF